jgi:hypothetical protein
MEDETKYNDLVLKLFKLLNTAERIDKLLCDDFATAMNSGNLDIVLQGAKEIFNHENKLLIRESQALIVWLNKISIIFWHYLIASKKMIKVTDIDRTMKHIDLMISYHSTGIKELQTMKNTLSKLKENNEIQQSGWFKWSNWFYF